MRVLETIGVGGSVGRETVVGDWKREIRGREKHGWRGKRGADREEVGQ
jgi:hypothetical protein